MSDETEELLTEETAEAEETGAENAAETPKKKKSRKKQTAETAVEEEEILTLIYIGPSIPMQKLAQNNIISGTKAEIDAYIARMSERFPKFRYLLVPPEKLAESKQKVRHKGNLLNRYYEDMLREAAHRKN